MNTDLRESQSFLPDTCTTNDARQIQNPDVKFYLRKRYFVCLWTCLGYMIVMVLGTNMSIALVELTSDKNMTTENGTILKKAELELDSKTMGFILSSFSFGMMLAPVGGILAGQFGGVRIFGVGIFIAALLTISTKFMLRFSFHFLVLMRFLIGVPESSSSSAFINIFTHWAPPHERSRLIAFSFIGVYVGTLISFSLGGFLAQNYGVDSIFIVTGGIGLVWCIVWFLFVSNKPSTDSFISQAERKYFENFKCELAEAKIMIRNYPWKSILTSKPAWAIFNEYFCFGWLTKFIIMCLPLYIKDTSNVDVESVGFISSIPILGNLMGITFFSFVADYLRSNGILTIANIHRLFAAVGQLSCAVFLLLISFWANSTQSVILFTLMRFFSGSAELTYQVAIIDIFGEYSGIIRGIALSFFNLAALLSPTVMGFIVTDHSRESWNLYFAFLSVFNIFGLIVFLIYGSGKLQKWAAPKMNDKSTKRNSAIPLSDKKMTNLDVKFCLRKRYFVYIWTSIGFMLLMIYGVNMSIVMAELTSNKYITTENGTIFQKAEVEWDSKMKGLILGAGAIGFMVAPAGGILAAKFGGVRVYGLGILMLSLLTISTSYLLRSNYLYLVLVRFLIGLFESISFASFINIFTHWSPPHERSRSVAIASIGYYVGILISFILGGFLARHFGVDSVFFVTGGAGLAWYIIWIVLVSNKPSSDRFITKKEREFFESYQHQETKVQTIKFRNYPWKSILTSKPAWAIFNEYFCFSWLTGFIMACLPLYIKDTFNVDIESAGFISSIPILGNLMGALFFSFIADYLRSNGIMRIGSIHRLFAAIGQLSCAVFLLIISFWATYIQSVILFTIMRFFAGAAELTYQVAVIDMFCEYSGIIRGISQIFLAFAGLFGSTVMGFIVTDHSQASWNLYFAFLSVFNIFGLIIFFIFGSGELQEWAAPKVTDEPKNSTVQSDNNM